MEPSDKDPTSSKELKKHVTSVETNSSKTLSKKDAGHSKTSAVKKSEERKDPNQSKTFAGKKSQECKDPKQQNEMSAGKKSQERIDQGQSKMYPVKKLQERKDPVQNKTSAGKKSQESKDPEQSEMSAGKKSQERKDPGQIKSSAGKKLQEHKDAGQNKTSAGKNPQERKGPGQSKKSVGKKSQERVDVSNKKIPSVILFDEEPSLEFKETVLNVSTSSIIGEHSEGSCIKKKRSYRKISFEVSSSLPLEIDSDDEEENKDDEKDNVVNQPDTNIVLFESFSKSKASDPVIPAAIKSMTKEEIEEHISCCLQLSTENKINTKNAFALKLIDCMTIAMKGDKKEDNFAAVACQLDAGAKIYSNRVDALHNQTLKLAESCLYADKKEKDKNESEENNTGDEEDTSKTPSEKSKRTKIKKKILADPSQITRKLKGKDPRENYVQLEARPGGILEKARRDPKDLSLTLEKHVPFWRDGPGHRDGGLVPMPHIELKSRQICPGVDIEGVLNSYHKLSLEDPQAQLTTPAELSSQSDDPGPSTSEYNDPQPLTSENQTLQQINSPDSDGERDNDFENCAIDTKLNEDLSILSIAESRMTEQLGSKPSRMEVIKTLFHTEGEHEYDYLKWDSKQYWAGPSYWKRSQGIAAANKKKNIRKKKEPTEIYYEKESSDETLDKSKIVAPAKRTTSLSKRTTSLSKRTLANWSKKKVTYPVDIHFEPESLHKLFNINLTVSVSGDETRLINSEEDEVNDERGNQGEETGDVDPVENNNDSYDEDNLPLSEIPCNDQTSTTLPNANVDDNSDENTAEDEAAGGLRPDSSDVYEGENLIPMVKTVQVEPIRFVAKPNRVDFKHLKEVMLAVIQEHIEGKENQEVNNEEPQQRPVDVVPFRDVLYELFNSNRLQHRTREDLSVAMAFFCLLTLANENGFALDQPENSTNEDILIRYALPPQTSRRQSRNLSSN